MNLLEHSVTSIHSIREITPDDSVIATMNDIQYYLVDMTTNCYGCVERKEYVFSKSELDAVMKTKTFMA